MTSHEDSRRRRAVPELPDAVRAFLAIDDRFERITADPSYAVQMMDDILEEEGEDVLHAASQGRWRKVREILSRHGASGAGCSGPWHEGRTGRSRILT